MKKVKVTSENESAQVGMGVKKAIWGKMVKKVKVKCENESESAQVGMDLNKAI